MEGNKKSNIWVILMSVLSFLAVQCKYEIFVGNHPESALLNGLNKLQGTFNSPDFADIFVVAAIYMLLRYVINKDSKIDKFGVVVSLVLATTLLTAISFKKYNSADMLLANSYQLLISALGIVGWAAIIYATLRSLCYLFDMSGKKASLGKVGRFVDKHILLVGFCVIFVGWMPWILLNYPGSGCPDSVLQFKQFFGDASWGAGHPPLSTVIMGSLFVLGEWLVDANFGFFLYCFMQTVVGAWIFSLSMKKLYDMGISMKWCALGIAYFAFTPFWGTYAQWVEKDLFYAEIVVLQLICTIDIMVKKECSRKDAILLAITSLLAVLLRNNGIYAVLPTLILMAIAFKGLSRKRIVVLALTLFVIYKGVMEGLYPALGIQKVSALESLSIPFQQTARYVCEHTEEVTEYEKEVLDREFGYDTMFLYDPIISDPIKIHFRCVDLGEYWKVWGQMFVKHPETYVAAAINKCYGYIAPVAQNIEAWIQQKYYDYQMEMGIYHTFGETGQHILITIWNLSMTLPILKYLATAGFYTWIGIALAYILWKKHKVSALIPLVPSVMNVLVCIASPLATSMRYELPTIASIPLLIGWTYYAVHHAESWKGIKKRTK